MKRRNLFLSLISSVLVAVAIVTVTIVTVIQPKKKNEEGGQVVTPIVSVNDNKKYEDMNEFERNGSKEYPYVIYSADSFNNMIAKFGGNKRIVTKPVTEIVEKDGKQVETVKYDSEGYVIFEKVLDSYGNEIEDVYYFELVKDIDFAGTNYETLFNYGKPFIGNIDGKGFALNNISINVTTENLESKFSYVLNEDRYARIAIFGEMNGSTIKDLTINSLSVNVANDVYGFISGTLNGDFVEMVTGGLAGVANNVTLENVDINASVAGASYVDSAVSGNNAIGGVAAVANNLKMVNSDVNVEITANSGRGYLLGGVAGYGRTVELNECEISADIKSTFSRKLNMAGLFAYAKGITVTNTDVNFAVSETADKQAEDVYVSNLTRDNAGNECLAKAADMSAMAGLVVMLRANDSTQEATFTNVNVNSNVDFAGMFAGVVYDIYSTHKVTFGLVEFKNVIVNSNVDVLVAHAFARQLVATTISYDNTDADGYYNIKLTGNVEFDSYTGKVIVVDILTGESEEVTNTYFTSLLTCADEMYKLCDAGQLYFQVSTDINASFMASGNPNRNTIMAGTILGGYKVIAG